MFRSDLQAAFRCAAALAALATAGCSVRMDMYDQPKYKPLDGSTFFADGRASRDFPKNTVARGLLHDDEVFYKGREAGGFATHFPMPVTRELLMRGQQRYNIYCTPCHDWAGTGRGMVVRRGFKQPPSFHADRLREVAPGYLFDVITNGYGTMSGYGAHVPAEDRWAIVSYIRALQLSQNARLAELPADERQHAEQALRQAASPQGTAAPHPESGGH
jgi:hypothetical protein